MENIKPLAIDLCCGLGGWTDGLILEGYYVVGFDIEQHQYGDQKYSGQLVIQDILTLHGKQFKDAALIVASPPCQEYSYMAMPWSLAKEKRRKLLSGEDDPKRLTALFDACFRIQREAIDAAGHFIPLVVENVRGAQEWVGRSRWNYGSFHLWGDVPALMPIAKAFKVPGFRFDGSGKSFQTASVEESGIKAPGMNWSNPELRGQDFTWIAGKHSDGLKCIPHRPTRHWTNAAENGVKFSQSGDALFDGNPRDKMLGNKGSAAFGSKSISRKQASAMIAKIPLPLSRYIAATYRPA